MAFADSRRFAEYAPEPVLAPHRRTAVLLLWTVLVLVYLALLPSLPAAPFDGDSLMRLQQVRDLLHGQSWFDVTQHRMNPPGGAAMHWSRLVDVPLAGLILLLTPLLGTHVAEFAACTIVPLAYLAVAMLILRAAMLRLGVGGPALLGALLLGVLFPALPAAFAPMQIDHHTPQALAALAAAFLLLRAPSPRAAVLAGLICAAWLVISLEALPMVALLAALYGLRYAARADRSLAWFLTALAMAAPTLSLATRPWSEFTLWCDILLPAHWAAFGAGAMAAWVLPQLPGQSRPGARLLALGLLPLVCLPVLLTLLGPCMAGPFSQLDPLVRSMWFNHMWEGLPVWRTPWELALPALYMFVLVPAGLWAACDQGLLRGGRRMAWQGYTAFTLGASLYTLFVAREALVAQLLALPFAAALLRRFIPPARSLRHAPARILATLACLLLATPSAAALGARLLPPGASLHDRSVIRARQAARGLAACHMADLAHLPRGHVFTTYNAAPAVLAETMHSVETGGYHRNMAALHTQIAAFTGTPDQARAIIEGRHADYLAVCLDDDALAIMADGRPASLAARLLQGDPPSWLSPLPGFSATRLRAYSVE